MSTWTHPHASLILPAGRDNTDEWHDLRATGLGGSDAAPIMGEGHAGADAYTVWEKKTGRYQEEHNEQTLLFFERGNALEPHVVSRFLDEYNSGPWSEPLTARRVGMLRSDDHNFLTASPDRFVSDGGGLECKTAGSWSWRADAKQPDVVPRRYYWQVIHYLLVTGKPHWYLASLDPDTFRLLWWKIDTEDDQVRRDMDRLAERAAYVWQCVEKDTPPEVSSTTSEQMNARIDELDEDALDVSTMDDEDANSIVALVTRRWQLDEQLAPLQAERKQIDESLRLVAGASEAVAYQGRPLYTYRGHTRRSFDQAAFKKAHPDLAEEYTKETIVRRLDFTTD